MSFAKISKHLTSKVIVPSKAVVLNHLHTFSRTQEIYQNLIERNAESFLAGVFSSIGNRDGFLPVGLGSDTANFSDVNSAVGAQLDENGSVTVIYQGPNGLVSDRLNSIRNLTGSENDDLLLGNAQANVLTGNGGNDTLTGAQGADTFVFAPRDFGADIITDYEDGLDRLDVSAFSFGAGDLQSVISNAQQVDGNTLLTFADNNTVVLQGVQSNALDVSDFIA